MAKDSLRVLFISRGYPPETGGGGIGSYVACISPALVALGHEIHVLSCFPDQLSKDYVDRGVYIHRRRSIHLPGIGRALAASISERVDHAISGYLEFRRLGMHFDVIEIPDRLAEGLIFSLMGTVPIVAHLHVPHRMILQRIKIPMDRGHRWADFLEQISVQRADVVTSPSRLLAETLNADGWLTHPRVRIVRYPVDLNRWTGLPPAETTAPIILQVGRLEALKASEVVIRAAKLVSAAVPQLRVVFVGRTTGVYGEQMKNLAAGLGIPCEFVGQRSRDDLRREYARARVVVQPSRFDNFPMTVLEAMAAARPVVISEAVGTKELLTDTEAGRVVATEDPGALAAGLYAYLASPTHAGIAGREARALVEKAASPEKIAHEREAIYLEAIEERYRKLSKTSGGSDSRFAKEPLKRYSYPTHSSRVAAPKAHMFVQTLLGTKDNRVPPASNAGKMPCA